MSPRSRTAPLRTAVLLAALAAVYYAVAELGLSLAFLAPQVSPVWPPTGVALAAVLLFGPRVWPAIALGAFLVNLGADAPAAIAAGTAAGIATGNTLEAVVGARLLRRAGFRTALDRLRDVVALVLLAALGATAISATIGVSSLCLGGVEPWSRFYDLWRVWWLGDAMGALVVAPFLLAWAGAFPRRLLGRRAAELAALLVALTATGTIVFSGEVLPVSPHAALAYAVFPFVVWAALRFGQRGVTLITLLVSATAIVASVAGRGPFGGASPHQDLMLAQAFLAIVATTGLFLAAAIAERDRAESLRADLAREARERLEADSAALAEADRRKDEFLAMLGHELRNPLAPIRNALYLLRVRETSGRGAPGGEAPGTDVGRLLDILERQVGHLGRLVDDLLDVSRITRGEFALRREHADLRAVVAGAIEGVRPLFESLGHTLRVEQPDAEVPVEADAVRLEQVVTNLLNNAAKYTPPGGHVSVRLTRDGETAELAVTDDGTGIVPEFLPRVFDLFSQSDRSLDRKQGGLGIGLTLVQRIVHLHGGGVEVWSEGPGRGAEVRVRLPCAPAAERPVAGAEA